MEATKEIGLAIFADEKLKQQIQDELGTEFVEQCIDLAITKLPPEANKSTQKIKAHSNRFDHIKNKSANQTKTIYSQTSGYGNTRKHKYKCAVGTNPGDPKTEAPVEKKRDRRRKKHLRGPAPAYLNQPVPVEPRHLTPEQKQENLLAEQEAIKQNKADKVARGYIAPTKKKMKHQSRIYEDGYNPKNKREVPVVVRKKKL